MNSITGHIFYINNAVMALKDRIMAMEARIAGTAPTLASAAAVVPSPASAEIAGLRSELDVTTAELQAVKQALTESRSRILSAEGAARDATTSGRAIEASILLKCDELVRRIVRERMESQLEEAMLGIRQYVDEQLAAVTTAMSMQIQAHAAPAPAPAPEDTSAPAPEDTSAPAPVPEDTPTLSADVLANNGASASSPTKDDDTISIAASDSSVRRRGRQSKTAKPVDSPNTLTIDM